MTQPKRLGGEGGYFKPYGAAASPTGQVSNLKKVLDDFTIDIDWQAPRGLYWICGRQAHTVLTRNWFESCALGSIRPSFFLLPLGQGETLGVPKYEQRLNRKK
jgi:hypothetical protein